MRWSQGSFSIFVPLLDEMHFLLIFRVIVNRIWFQVFGVFRFLFSRRMALVVRLKARGLMMGCGMQWSRGSFSMFVLLFGEVFPLSRDSRQELVLFCFVSCLEEYHRNFEGKGRCSCGCIDLFVAKNLTNVVLLSRWSPVATLRCKWNCVFQEPIPVSMSIARGRSVVWEPLSKNQVVWDGGQGYHVVFVNYLGNAAAVNT